MLLHVCKVQTIYLLYINIALVHAVTVWAKFRPCPRIECPAGGPNRPPLWHRELLLKGISRLPSHNMISESILQNFEEHYELPHRRVNAF